MTHEPATWRRETHEPAKRPLATAMLRGARRRCPACGEGRLYRAYLKTVDACGACGEAIHHHRADDAPPYMTITLVGHLVVPLVLLAERMWAPALWVHMALWLPLAVLSSLVLLPLVKGALVGLQWAFYMHGFDPRSGGAEDWDGVGLASWRPPH